MDLENLEASYNRASEIYKKYQKIAVVCEANKYEITIVHADDYRQSGRVANLNYSASFDKGEIEASVSLYVGDRIVKYDISEIVDAY